ncbi:histamine H3 receptor-like [Pomacea canaliculata]|uniref:histamine H3 receptor-like n=1 Tax=Pomacea canaliculata TaxID=400727 RepID=UPI000D73A9C6|nr:histamine H3 receptor-like [Pomacea canaliculata]
MSGDMASSSDNSSTETPVDSNEAPLSYSATVVVGLMASVLSLLITVGNSFTLIVFALRKSLRKFGDFFIINLAVIDFILREENRTSAPCVDCRPGYRRDVNPSLHPYLLTGTWQAGFSYCKFWLLWDYVTPAASTFCICVISIDRYLLVVHPLLYRRIQSTRLLVIMLAIPWGGVFLIFGPSILLWELTFGPKIAPGVCHVPFSDYLPFLLFTSFVEFIIPFTVVAMTNVMLFLRIRTRMRTKVSDHFTPSPTHKSTAEVRDQDRSEQKATRVAVFTTQTASHLSPWKASTDKVSQEGSTTNNVVNLGLEVEDHTNTSMDDTGDVGEATTKQSSRSHSED